MPRQEGSIGSNGDNDHTDYHYQPDVHLINDIGSFIFHLYSWFKNIEIELLLMNPAAPSKIHECEDTMKQLKDMAVSIRSHKNRSKDVIDSLEILFNESEMSLTSSIVVIKEKITDLKEIIERVTTLLNKLRID